MIEQIDELVSRFERGQIDRRRFLGAIAALTWLPASLSSSATVPARNLTHVNIRVRDIKASEQFYRGLLGLPPAHTPDGAWVQLSAPKERFRK